MSGASAGEGLLVCCMAYAAAGIATRGLLVCFMAYAPAKAGGASCSRLAEVCWQMRPMHGFLRMPAPPNLGLSRHSLHTPQSGARHAGQVPHRRMMELALGLAAFAGR